MKRMSKTKLKEKYNLDNYDLRLYLYIYNHMNENHKRLYSNLVRVSKTGMTRKYNFYYIRNNELLKINNIIEKTTIFNTDKKGYIKVGGCGFSGENQVFTYLFQSYFKGYNKDETRVKFADYRRMY